MIFGGVAIYLKTGDCSPPGTDRQDGVPTPVFAALTQAMTIHKINYT
jgi:hypothetical protein